MTWHNLPCPPTLAAIAAACPRGWIELAVTHHAGNSGFSGGDPQEPDTVIHDGRMWGIEKTDLGDVEHILRDLWMDGDLHTLAKGIPSGATVLARIEEAPLVCNTCGANGNVRTMLCETAKGEVDGEWVGCTGLLIIRLALVTTWGKGGQPVYWTGEGSPDYTGQQAAPKPGHGDMWASLLEQWRGIAPPRIVELMEARRQAGIERYGTVLQAHNGRDVVRDLVEETLDRLVYSEQFAQEQPRSRALVNDWQGSDIRVILVGSQGGG